VKLIKKYAVVVLFFALGWAARGVLANTDAPVWLTVFVSAALLLVAFGVMAGSREGPKRLGFEEELSAYLRRTDTLLVTREMAAQKGLVFNVVESSAVPSDQVFVVNPSALRDMIAKLGADFVRPVDNKHLPGCRKRHDGTAKCICGERGFGGTNPMPPKFAQEFAKLHEDADPYVSPCTHSVGCPAHLGRPCPPKPGPSINPRTGLVWCWCARENCKGCPE
jgi:hypothetical protein